MSKIDLISLAEQPIRPFESIPVIDISGLSGDAESKAQVAIAIREACMHVGFFYVKNHGVDEAMICSAVDAARRFFDLPMEEKMKIDASKNSNFRGYVPFTQKGRIRECFDIRPAIETFLDTSISSPDGWPSEDIIPGFQEAVVRHHREVKALGLKLFSAFALALNLPEEFFADKVRTTGPTMRLMHYPHQDATVGDNESGIGEHTDFQCFTILWQDEHRALQVKNASGQWIDADPIPGTFVINIADQLARMTNDIFKSTIHQALHTSGGDRYSIPLFFGIDYDVNLEVLPSCISVSRPARYEPILTREYMKKHIERIYSYLIRESV